MMLYYSSTEGCLRTAVAATYRYMRQSVVPLVVCSEEGGLRALVSGSIRQREKGGGSEGSRGPRAVNAQP